jgi:hypothetical protein
MILNVLKRAGLAFSTAMIAAGLAAAPPALAQGNKCAEEATSIRRAEGQLPRLEVAPPGDRQIVPITLETNMLFARRQAAPIWRTVHARCTPATRMPGSEPGRNTPRSSASGAESRQPAAIANRFSAFWT